MKNELHNKIAKAMERYVNPTGYDVFYTTPAKAVRRLHVGLSYATLIEGSTGQWGVFNVEYLGLNTMPKSIKKALYVLGLIDCDEYRVLYDFAPQEAEAHKHRLQSELDSQASFIRSLGYTVEEPEEAQ